MKKKGMMFDCPKCKNHGVDTEPTSKCVDCAQEFWMYINTETGRLYTDICAETKEQLEMKAVSKYGRSKFSGSEPVCVLLQDVTADVALVEIKKGKKR